MTLADDVIKRHNAEQVIGFYSAAQSDELAFHSWVI